MTDVEKQTISLVVPVYNSSQSLGELVQRIDAALTPDKYTKELILVNDGSKDNSWAVIQQLVLQNNWVKGINHMRNFGQHNALLTGFKNAKHDIIVTLDDDLQHAPEDIPFLVDSLKKDVDVVYGVPDSIKQKHVKRIGSSATKWLLSRVMGGAIVEFVSAYRVFRASLKPVFEHYHGDYVNVDVLLSWATTSFVPVVVVHHSRKYGNTNYTFRKNFSHAINMITGFSILPLQIASILGFLLMFFGTMIFMFILWSYIFTGGIVKGFTFTLATITLFSGVQMFCLGIIGAYLARIHLRSSGKPMAIVREIIVAQ